MMVKRVFASCAFFIVTILSCSELYSQGLGFFGMDYKIDERTSYNVFGGEETESFAHLFQMSFDFSPKYQEDFGYVFRIKDNGDSERIWNLSYDSRQDSVVIRLNEEGRHSLIQMVLSKNEIPVFRWSKMQLVMDLDGGEVSLSVSGRRYTKRYDGFSSMITPVIEFGRSDYIIDVPSFSLKNLSVTGADKSFEFALDQFCGTEVYDSKRKVCGKVKNPDWLINRAAVWSEIFASSYEDIAGVSYNPIRKEFYYFTQNDMNIYSFIDQRSESIHFDEPCPIAMKLGNNFVSSDGRYLFCYELYNDEAPSGSPTVAKLDLDTKRWEICSYDGLDMPVHHHATFLNPADGQFSILGGFGNRLYNGEFYSFDEVHAKWNKVFKNLKGDPIYPRYFTSAGTDGKYVYIYGGMGNECGEQVVGRRYFYDLHRIDTQTGESALMWDLGWEGPDMVPVRNLIVDKDQFYTLCYPEYISQSHLYLYCFNISDGSYKRLQSPIPIISDKMRTNANIYLDRELNRFFAWTQVFDDDIKSTVRIYDLTYPPIFEIDRGEAKTNSRWIFFILCFMLCGSGIGLYFFRKHTKKGSMDVSYKFGRPFKYEKAPNQICIFGNFTVNDRNARDITSAFTNQQIIILCLLIRAEENGISSKNLSSILWPDKDEDKVKNSRGVAINNLRKSLGMLNEATIEYRDGRYYLELGDQCQCDYWDFMACLKNEKINETQIMNILSRGRILRSVNDPIFDEFKEQVDNMVLPLLLRELETKLKLKQYIAVEQLVYMVMEIDSTNEEALKAMVKSLRRQRKYEEVLLFYSKYCAEYKKVNDIEYTVPLKSL